MTLIILIIARHPPQISNRRKALKRVDGRELYFGWEEVGKGRRKVSLLREEIAFGGHFLRMGRGMAGEERRLLATRKHKGGGVFGER
jgi:hypothetical protein